VSIALVGPNLFHTLLSKMSFSFTCSMYSLFQHIYVPNLSTPQTEKTVPLLPPNWTISAHQLRTRQITLIFSLFKHSSATDSAYMRRRHRSFSRVCCSFTFFLPRRAHLLSQRQHTAPASCTPCRTLTIFFNRLT